MVYSTKNLSIQEGAVHNMKEEKKERSDSLLSLSRGGKINRVLWREGGKGLGLPIPIGPHKGTGAVERFHIAEPKGSTSIRDRSMSRRLVPAALKSTYALFPVH